MEAWKDGTLAIFLGETLPTHPKIKNVHLLGAHALRLLSGRANVLPSVSSFCLVNITNIPAPLPTYVKCLTSQGPSGFQEDSRPGTSCLLAAALL